MLPFEILNGPVTAPVTGPAHDLEGLYSSFTVQVGFSEGVPDDLELYLQGSHEGSGYWSDLNRNAPITEANVQGAPTYTALVKLANAAKVRYIRARVGVFNATTQPEAALNMVSVAVVKGD